MYTLYNCISTLLKTNFPLIVTYPKDLDLSNPASVGLFGTRSLHLSVLDPDADERHDGVRIGIWHVLPLQLAKRFAQELRIDMVSNCLLTYDYICTYV